MRESDHLLVDDSSQVESIEFLSKLGVDFVSLSLGSVGVHSGLSVFEIVQIEPTLGTAGDDGSHREGSQFPLVLEVHPPFGRESKPRFAAPDVVATARAVVGRSVSHRSTSDMQQHQQERLGQEEQPLVTDGGQSVDVAERLGKWHTDPWTLGRIGEIFVRATLAGLVGIAFSLGVASIFGESTLTLIGLMTPLYFTMKWGFPDHYADTGTERSDGGGR